MCIFPITDPGELLRRLQRSIGDNDASLVAARTDR